MNIFDETLVIVVESTNVGGVYSVNGKAGYVTLDKSDISLSNVENISIIVTSGYLQNQINNNQTAGDFVYLTGNQTISGLKSFTIRPQVNGTGILLSGEAAQLPNTIVYNTGNQIVSGIKNFQNDVQLDTINGNTSFGIYNYLLDRNYHDQYLKQEGQLGGLANTVSGIKNRDIVNFYFKGSDGDINPNGRKTALKVNPGILVDHNGDPSNRNLIKFPDDSIYAGKAIRKVRYNSTIGNGYERINLTNLSVTGNPAIIRPLTRRLETFYDISVPSGGGVRALYFNIPTSPHFVQGLCMNLRFSFEADSSPCVISGYSAGGLVFLLTGANYNFVQKERVILINKATAPHYEFKHW